MMNARRIYTEVLRTAFCAVFLFVAMLFGVYAIRGVDMITGILMVWCIIIGLRVTSIFLFPDEKRGTTRREQAADLWNSILKTFLLAPVIAFLYVVQVQQSEAIAGLDLNLNIALELQALWLAGSAIIFGIWLGLSYRQKRRVGYSS